MNTLELIKLNTRNDKLVRKKLEKTWNGMLSQNISKDEIDLIHNLHIKWLKSDGEEGAQAIISNMLFKEILLENYNWEYAFIYNVSFERCNLKNSSFSNSDLRYVLISHSTCYGLTFNNTNLSYATVTNSYLTDCNFTNAALIKSEFNNCELKLNNFSLSNCYEAKFFKCNLFKTKFEKSNLTKASFLSSNLTKLQLNNANLESCRILECIILGVNFNDTIFDNRELRIFLANKARIMLGWLDLISFTNGKWPLINDSTENTSLSKTELESNFSKVNIYKQSTNLISSGFRKFQSGLGQIIINIGEISPKYQPGHSHSDILSFYFSDGINQLIVDTGVSTYENNVVRYMERSTSLHNTVTINNFNQSDVWGSFRVGKRAKVIIHSENLNHIIAEVNNLLYSNNANHVRELILDDDSLVVKDRVFCKKDNLISTLHFNWTLNPQIKNDIIYFDCFKVEFLEGLKEIKIVNYSQAIEYNLTKNASKMVALVNKFSVFKISRNI